jgi:hypothetical protein
MKLPTHNRYDYVPITKRADYTCPGGKRLAVYFCNNIEYSAFGAALAANTSGRPAYIEFICSQYPVYGRWVGRSAE